MKFFVESRRFLLGAGALYCLLKVLFVSGILSSYIEQITLYAFIVIIVSLGLNVIYGFTGQFSLGQAAFYGIGAYAAAYVTKTFQVDGPLFFVPLLFLGGAVAGLIGCLIGIPILRLKDDFLAIATLGFGILVRVLLDNSDRFSEILGGSRGFVGVSRITTLETTLLVTVFLVIVTRNLIYSRYGLFWRCIRDDEPAAAAAGIDTARMKLLAFVYGCFLAGVGGGLYAHLYTFLHPSNFDVLKSIDFLVIVIVGGMGSIRGTILSGLLWVGFIEGLRIVLPSNLLELRWVFIPALLILLMIWRPYGLIVKTENRK
jgi:branched-chain amino acid transport system permease protein